ncbi:hypothetical protein GCM10008171_26920 [Methylopila jiangsuensis]|uniref:Uncharacterized protein n=1 Tax=Methylopila jiangsuensis TaxID=586230 RepID=A0A9W6JKZ7_9HYPH|nr:hypothetical protein [Methylopila jiangsuensis]MDR6285173.1 hypothetical protein [Methylopila jiangsuensis]GLK77438.1 hypothetical protein GCM10008171_26920 [Methylopila jiangsuensis]
MTRLAEAAEPADDLFLDERLAAEAAEIEDLIARAHGDPRAAIGALLVQLAEIERARAEADRAASLGFRRGLQPERPA